MSASFRFVRYSRLHIRLLEPFRPCAVREDVLFWRTLFLLPFVCMLEQARTMKTAPVAVTQPSGPFEVDAKRFRVPAVLRSTCPECGEECERDLGRDNCLGRPSANEPLEVTMCHECKGSHECHEWTVRIILRVTVEAAPDITIPARRRRDTAEEI